MSDETEERRRLEDRFEKQVKDLQGCVKEQCAGLQISINELSRKFEEFAHGNGEPGVKTSLSNVQVWIKNHDKNHYMWGRRKWAAFIALLVAVPAYLLRTILGKWIGIL